MPFNPSVELVLQLGCDFPYNAPGCRLGVGAGTGSARLRKAGAMVRPPSRKEVMGKRRKREGGRLFGVRLSSASDFKLGWEAVGRWRYPSQKGSGRKRQNSRSYGITAIWNGLWASSDRIPCEVFNCTQTRLEYSGEDWSESCPTDDNGPSQGDYLWASDSSLVSSDATVSSGSSDSAYQSIVSLNCWPHGTTALTARYRTPDTTYLDECIHHFINQVFASIEGTSMLRPWALVTPSLGNYCPSDPKPIQEVARQFHDQTRDPVLSRTVYGNKRFIRDEAMPRWQSRFKTTSQSYDGVDFDWISVPDTDVWLPSHQQLRLIIDHNCLNPNVNFRRLIIILTPLIEEAMKNLLVEYVYAVGSIVPHQFGYRGVFDGSSEYSGTSL
ncbi:hypothetical protein B0H14DRAFT_3135327 [Mycena olivaceomarginata]|nr:hypothetical protein B0H14DRAFT_3135327 [Mycena olivaceomarginata]